MIHHGSLTNITTKKSINKPVITSIDVSNDLIAIGFNDGSIELLKIIPTKLRLYGKKLVRIVIPNQTNKKIVNNMIDKSITRIKISPCLTRLCFGNILGELLIFNIQDIYNIRLIVSHDDHCNYSITSISWSYDSNYLYSSCTGGQIIECQINKYIKLNDNSSLSLDWAKNFLGYKTGKLIYTCDSSVHQLVYSNKCNVNNSQMNESGLLLVSTYNQTLLLVLQYINHSPDYVETVHTSTILLNHHCFSKQLPIYLASAYFTLSASTINSHKYVYANSFIVCRLNQSTNLEIVYCDIEGQSHESYDLHWIDRPVDDSLFGIRSLISSNNNDYKHIYFGITDSNRLVLINLSTMSIQYFPLSIHLSIHSISISNSRLVILYYDVLSNYQSVDLYEFISSSITTFPITVYPSLLYQKIQSIQKHWIKYQIKHKINNKLLVINQIKNTKLFLLSLDNIFITRYNELDELINNAMILIDKDLEDITFLYSLELGSQINKKIDNNTGSLINKKLGINSCSNNNIQSLSYQSIYSLLLLDDIDINRKKTLLSICDSIQSDELTDCESDNKIESLINLADETMKLSSTIFDCNIYSSNLSTNDIDHLIYESTNLLNDSMTLTRRLLLNPVDISYINPYPSPVSSIESCQLIDGMNTLDSGQTFQESIDNYSDCDHLPIESNQSYSERSHESTTSHYQSDCDTSSEDNHNDWLKDSSSICWLDKWIVNNSTNPSKQIKDRLCQKNLNQHKIVVTVDPIESVYEAVRFDLPPMTYELNIYAPLGLGCTVLLSTSGSVVITSFKHLSNGYMGPLEMSGVVSVGDKIVSINDQLVEGMGWPYICNLLQTNNMREIGKETMKLRLRYKDATYSDQFVDTDAYSQSSETLVDNLSNFLGQQSNGNINPLFDMFGPLLLLNDKIDSNNVSVEYEDDNSASSEYLDSLSNSSSPVDFIDGQNSKNSKNKLSDLTLSLQHYIKSNHLYPIVARTNCISIYENTIYDFSETIWEYRRIVYPCIYCGYYQSNFIPKLMKNYRDTGIYKYVDLDMSIVKSSDSTICSYDYLSDTQMTHSGNNTADFTLLLQNVITKYLDIMVDSTIESKLLSDFDEKKDEIEIMSTNTSTTPSELDNDFDTLHKQLLNELKKFRNQSIRNYKRLSNQVINNNTIEIPIYSDLGPYLPNYDITMKMYSYVNENYFTIIYGNLFKLLDIWIQLFNPLLSVYYNKLWDFNKWTDEYIHSHGFRSVNDMRHYIRLVSEFATLYYMLLVIPNHVCDKTRISKDMSLMIYLPYGVCYCTNNNISNQLIECNEDKHKQFVYKYMTYLLIDIITCCCGIRCHRSIQLLVYDLISNDNTSLSISNYLPTIYNNINENNSKNIINEMKRVSNRNNHSSYSILLQQLGVIYSKNSKLAVDISISCYPFITPYHVSITLFGDNYNQTIIPDDQTTNSDFEDESLQLWYNTARKSYQHYLQHLIRRHRLGHHQELIHQWLHLLLYLWSNSYTTKDVNTNLPNDSKQSIKSSNYTIMSNIRDILTHNKEYSYNYHTILNLCYKYRYYEGCLLVIKNILYSSQSIDEKADSTIDISNILSICFDYYINILIDSPINNHIDLSNNNSTYELIKMSISLLYIYHDNNLNVLTTTIQSQWNNIETKNLTIDLKENISNILANNLLDIINKKDIIKLLNELTMLTYYLNVNYFIKLEKYYNQ